MFRLALIGAGGKMGCRLTDNLLKTDIPVTYVEIGEEGLNNLAVRGLSPTPQDEAVRGADVVVLAVPDVSIGTVTESITPEMKTGAILVLLDPAALYMNEVRLRDDIAVFVTHPCHPPVFNYDATPEERRDFFGGIKAPQAIVCALHQGTEENYGRGEYIAKTIYAPVTRAHRITVEQMALLEPTMAETIGAALATLAKEAMDTAVMNGVPPEAARDFMLGHINIELGIVFGEAGNPFSDAAKVAIEYGRRRLFRDNWQELFLLENVREQIDVMLHPEKLMYTIK
ncbi:phosphogluconate dehydrogenase C-terminal domain-containing protein [Alicyclobacillus mengziensis]|uniref:NAD(P)-binding domain-containing protein n=1 Tax=Alicyclobacillus mengziensis TaxID=2931921 RepID=A0A9X7VYD8_9BACL|nr:phosphogluconate dehydrogenase C-terminal domain-containing protein [Alicyclobacillus mengziensis]QSO47319.1 NAD(P)-binding domain-containing protein [Alicyclobacillus mengziensis]